MPETIPEKRAARAAQLAHLAVLINYETVGSEEDSVEAAEAILVAAENLVAKKYGEFR